eukprot:99807-Chlamydomonas_euryale.AAC.2
MIMCVHAYCANWYMYIPRLRLSTNITKPERKGEGASRGRASGYEAGPCACNARLSRTPQGLRREECRRSKRCNIQAMQFGCSHGCAHMGVPAWMCSHGTVAWMCPHGRAHVTEV